jgi:hypothetical protein
MQAGSVYETTFIDVERDLAFTAVSLPRSRAISRHIDSAGLLDAIGLRALLEFPGGYLADAVSALLATDDADEAATWLLEPPDVVPAIDLRRPAQWPERSIVAEDQTRLLTPSPPSRAPRTPKLPRKPPPKNSPEAQELQAFARLAVTEPEVPFAQSPVDLHSLNDLFAQAAHAGAWLSTARKHPVVLAEAAGGWLLLHTTIGIAGGIRRGLSDGVRYRILKIFGAPTGDDQ